MTLCRCFRRWAVGERFGRFSIQESRASINRTLFGTRWLRHLPHFAVAPSLWRRM
jgi:hypothetical protein